jgi:hypothetical protein
MNGIIRDEDRIEGAVHKAQICDSDSAYNELMLYVIGKRLPLIIEQVTDQARWWIRETPARTVPSVTVRLPYGDVNLRAVHNIAAQDLIMTALQEVEPNTSSVTIGTRDREEHLQGIPVVVCFNPPLA